MNSPVDFRAHDDHLKDLLGQRAARADLHGRYPSLSEFSDSPSVYSHAHFSPRPTDRPILDGHSQSFRFPQSPKVYTHSISDSPRSPISDRERLAIPNASSLDLDDDPRSSAELNSLHEDEDDSPPEEEEEELPRISMYGPKMRFHSPAPWEEDDTDAKSIVDEPPKRSKKKPDAGKKGWPLSKPIPEPRPSNDSSRSGSGKGKQSFDAASTFSANGALAALAQASMSSTSLGMQQSHQSPQSLRDKLSLPRLRSRTPSNVGLNEFRSPSHPSPISRIATPPHADVYRDDSSLLGRSSTSSGPQHEYSHPYANPDLARPIDDLPPPSPAQMSFGAIRSDSNATLTDTTPSSSVSQFRSTTTFSMTPGTSVTSMNPSLNESTSSRMGGKSIGISSPMPVDKSALHPDALGKLNGYTQSPITPASALSPLARNRDTTITMGGINAWESGGGGGGGGAFKLISLEEAQAQIRERSRSHTAHPTISSPYSGPSRPLVLETDIDPQRMQGRARSSSAGGKGKSMVETPRGPGDSPISGPTRQVNRKKSGFMRLFNGKERVSPSSPPPPVPLYPNDAFAANPPPPPPPSQYARPRQASTSHRVPVPSLSPSVLGDSVGSIGSGSGSPADSPPESSTGSSSSASNGMREQQQQQLSARRKVPDLSIVTNPPSMNLTVKAPYTAPLSAGSSSDLTHHHHLTPTTAVNRAEFRSNGSSPSSAPPTKADFVGLSIRPMSTLFTRELKELAVTDGTRPSLEVDTGTPTTATTAISPLSPDFPGTKNLGYGGRSSDEKSGHHISIAQDDRDQSSVIQALQEQILSSRRMWQRQIWELEGQVRDLKAEVEELRAADGQSEYCMACGRGSVGRPSQDDASGGRQLEDLKKAGVKVGGVVNRPRARTGVGSRFASGT
ncbi:hypothetical protein L227DRAFT_495206 [Lentinus tigrinus ALCF2SS1-6]|uniref:Uncharacterized protein n=1 Tax=Lentinus tigrinus ALCF2SS1-6 TaxID=1328759 RepID=A0A5C2SM99_9APHY|nr:hypothetical protein L227DRAFT_495206 [Lentinus tigrinus ALCF2SS1-6]